VTPSGEYDYDAGYIRVYANRDFPGRTDGLVVDGIYEKSDNAAHEQDFRAGSYSSYSAWREQLAILAGYPEGTSREEDREFRHSLSAWNNAEKTKGLPFWELIDFSDCEGTIGPVVSAKLAKDFAEQQPKADAIGGYFLEKYNQWRHAFELASDGGAVVFR